MLYKPGDGKVFSADPTLQMYLKQLSSGGMVIGMGITCAEYGVNSALDYWHAQTAAAYGENYLDTESVLRHHLQFF